MFQKNKFTKYFLYAIGEIVLVVIGILIALQINNWNENKLRLKQEKVLLSEVKEELLSIYDDIYSDLRQLNQGEISHYRILDWLNDKSPYIDSLAFDFYLLTTDEYIYPISARYDKIKMVGLDIIRNESIRANLQNLYETQLSRLGRENNFYPNISEYLDEFMVEHFKMNEDYSLQKTFKLQHDSILKINSDSIFIMFPQEIIVNGKPRPYTAGYVPIDPVRLKENSEFKMLLHSVDGFRAYKIGRYTVSKNLIIKLLEQIDKELSND